MNRETMPAPGRPGQDRLAPHAVRADEAGRTAWLLCRSGKVRIALPIENVVEIMRMLPLEPLAGAPKYVSGLSVVRGAPVPVVDIGLLVAGKITHPTRLVAIRTGARITALAVDDVIGISPLAEDAFGRLPPLLQDVARETIDAIGALDSELLVCLRTGRLVPEELLARVAAEEVTS